MLNNEIKPLNTAIDFYKGTVQAKEASNSLHKATPLLLQQVLDANVNIIRSNLSTGQGTRTRYRKQPDEKMLRYAQSRPTYKEIPPT